MNIYNSDILEIFKSLNFQENNFFKNKKILLLGSDGFIGKYFLYYFDYLIKNKIKLQLHCVDNNISSSKFRLSEYNKKLIKFYHTDILKFNTKYKYDLVIFLAGIASPKIYKKFPIESLEVSYLGVKKFLDKCKKDKSTLVFFSSSEVYGNPNIKNIPTLETYYGNVNSYGPRACYDEGKRVGETLCYIHKEYYKTKLKVIRPFNVFGPGMNKQDDRVVPKFIRSLRRKKLLEIYNNGKQTRSFCYITDAMIGFLKVIVKGKNGNIYNVGNDKEEISMNKLARKIQLIFSDKKVKLRNIKYPNSYPSNEPQRRKPNIKKIYLDTGYKPKLSLKDSLERFIKYF